MKLRLRKNSIRLRLLKSEIAQLKEKGFVSEEIRFDTNQSITYTIQVENNKGKITSCFENDKIIISVPSILAKSWIETEKVGLEQYQIINENLGLRILLEKDFICLTRPMDSDNMDSFPNPETKTC